MSITLTGPQHRALVGYVAVQGYPGWSPRRDVLRRLAGLGLVKLRMELMHQGLTYRSRQRLDIVHIALTEAGRDYIAEQGGGPGHRRRLRAHLPAAFRREALTHPPRTFGRPDLGRVSKSAVIADLE